MTDAKNVLHTFRPRNRTEEEMWTALTTGHEVFVSRDNRHSQRRRNAINRMRACGVDLLRTDMPWHRQFSYVLGSLTRRDCITNKILADAESRP